MIASKLINHPLSLIIGISILINALLWFLSIQFFPTDESVVLHYSATIGIDFIGNSRQITTLPLIGLFIIIGNFILGILLRPIDLKTAWILWGIIPITQLMLLGAFSLIRLANQ